MLAISGTLVGGLRRAVPVGGSFGELDLALHLLVIFFDLEQGSRQLGELVLGLEVLLPELVGLLLLRVVGFALLLLLLLGLNSVYFIIFINSEIRWSLGSLGGKSAKVGHCLPR